MVWVFDDGSVLLHQGIGLGAFNELPEKKAVHALYECCNSVILARDLARGRPYADHNALYRRADALLFSLSETSIDDILQAYPHVGTRPRSTKSAAEHCSVWDERPEVMAELKTVDPDIAVGHHAVELEDDAPPGEFLRERKMFAIPDNAAGQKRARPRGGIRFGKRTFDAPVVRH